MKKKYIYIQKMRKKINRKMNRREIGEEEEEEEEEEEAEEERKVNIQYESLLHVNRSKYQPYALRLLSLSSKLRVIL